MKITESKTKSLTFIFNKDDEYKSFLEVLSEGITAVEKANTEGWEGTPPSWVEVVDSIRRNILSGYTPDVRINVSDATNGLWSYNNGQGQWTPMPQGTERPIPMPTITV